MATTIVILLMAVFTAFYGSTTALALDAAQVFTPGAAGAGDPYFPNDGNGGYDVQHYLLHVQYDPETDHLTGVTTIKANTTQNLSQFNLDLDGLTVTSITVDGQPATWTRNWDELTITPSRGLPNGAEFVTVIEYDGVPKTIELFGGPAGFIHTDDGALVVGQPHVADTWFPANDHPIDPASFTFMITVPEGLEAIANGVLESTETNNGWTTWTWKAEAPMSTYLTGIGIGEFDIREYSADGIQFWDAFDPELFALPAPRTGEQFAISQKANFSYKRLSREIEVPAEGATLSLWVFRHTDPEWDFFFVEAHTLGADDWTTLPDINGHTTQNTGSSCPFWLELHPFLEHYQTPRPPSDAEALRRCEPTGTTGEWWAASGVSDGWEQWVIDLSAWANETLEVSLTYTSDSLFQFLGVFIDDIVVSTGTGTTSFEADGDELDGWTVLGAPPSSPGNSNDWIVGTAADTPLPLGEQVEASLDRQPEMIDFLADITSPYPFSVAGGIVDNVVEFFFALENQTRPIYSPLFFLEPIIGDLVVVHELAHQWFGDSLTLERWRDIWLNEGFATYMEWLWLEREGIDTPQAIFDYYMETFPADNSFWDLVIGDPGPDPILFGTLIACSK
jgi:Peptidase family M1 domain/Peptidase M1 N-terminal domain